MQLCASDQAVACLMELKSLLATLCRDSSPSLHNHHQIMLLIRYQRLLHMLNSTRDYEEDDQVARIDDYKLAVLSNMALCAHQQGEYAKAVEWCDKALEMDPDNAKVCTQHSRG